jgi:hypothetical protein
MRNSKYVRLLLNPPKLKVEGKPRQIKIDLISSMCDNRYRWSISQNDDGDYKIFTNGFAYSNFGIKYKKDDIEWEMDEGNWDLVWRMINSGYQIIENLKYR